MDGEAAEGSSRRSARSRSETRRDQSVPAPRASTSETRTEVSMIAVWRGCSVQGRSRQEETQQVTGRCEQQRYHLWTITTFRLFIVSSLWRLCRQRFPLRGTVALDRTGHAAARWTGRERDASSRRQARSLGSIAQAGARPDSIRARQRRTEGERSGGRSFMHPTGCGKWADQEQPTACWFDPAAKRKQRRRGPEQVDRWDNLRAALTEIVGMRCITAAQIARTRAGSSRPSHPHE